MSLVVKNPAADCRRCKRCEFDPWGQEDPLKEDMAIHSIILENPMNRGAWRTIIHRVTNSQTQLKRQPVCLSTHRDLTAYVSRLAPEPSRVYIWVCLLCHWAVLKEAMFGCCACQYHPWSFVSNTCFPGPSLDQFNQELCSGVHVSYFKAL